MTIDAIGSVVAGVGSLAASRTELASSNGQANTGPPAAAGPPPSGQQDATIVDISAQALAQQRADEALAQQRAAEALAQQRAAEALAQQRVAQDLAAQQAAQDLAAQQAAQDLAAQQVAQQQAAVAAVSPADVAAVTTAVNNDWAAGAPVVDNVAVQEALAALDQASRENNVQLQASAISAQQDQAAFEQKTVDAAASAAVQQQDNIVLAAMNAGIQLAFGALATPITGDPALREPGRVEIVA